MSYCSAAERTAMQRYGVDDIVVSPPDLAPSIRQRRVAFTHDIILPYDTRGEENEQLIIRVVRLLLAEQPTKNW